MKHEKTIDDQITVLDPQQVQFITGVADPRAQHSKGFLHNILIAVSPMYKNYEGQIIENDLKMQKLRTATEIFQRELSRRESLSHAIMAENRHQFEEELGLISESLADIRNDRTKREKTIDILHRTVESSLDTEERLFAMKMILCLHKMNAEQIRGCFALVRDAGERHSLSLQNSAAMLLSSNMEEIRKCLER